MHQQLYTAETIQYLGEQICIIPVQSGQFWHLDVSLSRDIEWIDRETSFTSRDEALQAGMLRGRQLIENRW